MDIEFDWNLLSSNSNMTELWVYGVATTNTTDPVFWNFYPSLVEFLYTQYTGAPVTCFNVNWNAYLRIFDIDQMPTLYQGCLPKYKLGSWAKSYAGLVFDQGFVNYQYQRICGGIFNTQQELYTPYGESGPAFPSTGIIDAEYLVFTSLFDIQGAVPHPDFGDNVYTQIEVSAFQSLFLYAAVDVQNTEDNNAAYILL